MYKVKIPAITLTVDDEEEKHFLDSLISDGSFWSYITSLIQNDGEVHKAELVDEEHFNTLKAMMETMTNKLNDLETTTNQLKSSGIVSSAPQSEPPKSTKPVTYKKKKKKSKEALKQLEDSDFGDLLNGFDIDERF